MSMRRRNGAPLAAFLAGPKLNFRRQARRQRRRLRPLNEAPERRTLEDVRGALETVGVKFISQNGGGPGVRLRHRQQ